MSLTVLHVLVPEPPGEVGGADMHVHDLARYQASAGLAPIVAERGSAEFAARIRGADVEVVSATGMSFQAAVRRLAKVIAGYEVDVVHAHGYDADYWAAATRRRYPGLFRNRPMVFTQHGVVEDTAWHRCKTLLDAVCSRSADGVIVCAAGLAGRMRRWCPAGSVRYIPNGVRAPDLIPPVDARRLFGLPQEAFVIGYIGRLSPEKRPGRLLTLVADARAAGAPVTALVAGSGSLRPELERQAELLGIRDSVVFAGLVPAVGNVYSALDAVVLLSDTETTSRVVIEAMTTGVPVLASAVGGVPELLDGGRAGHLVPAGDRRAALDGLRHLMSEPGQFVGVARKRARELYPADAMGRQVTEFYEELRDGVAAGRGGRMSAGAS
jgi:glycosyltransferase involved in cell wall biosynthesis